MKFENLLVERAGAVLTVTLNRPDKLNSLSLGLLRDLDSCAEGIQRDATLRAVVLTGAGRGFCAGADLTDPDSVPGPGQTMGQFVAARLRAQFNPVVLKWASLPVPLVVAVNGVAAGAGVSVALMGDITIAARSASFATMFAPKLGLAPDMGATYFLPTRIGPAKARALALTGEPIGGEQAERIGLIADCVDDALLMPQAEQLATRLAAGPTRALVVTRELINRAAAATLAEQLEQEAAVQHRLADSSDFAEGVQAFRERRTPSFHKD